VTDSNHEQQTPALDAVYEDLVETIEGWANALGTDTTYTDPVLAESGDHDWAAELRKQVDWAVRTAGTLLTAQGKTNLAEDLKRRVEELCVVAEGYEQRLEALEDQRRVHIEGIVARYRQVFGNEDPEAARMMRLCQGIQRVWLLRVEDHSPETPEEFAEAIDRAWFEEDGAKRRAQAEMKCRAGELVEHLRLLAGLEANQPAEATDADRQVQAAQTTSAGQSEDVCAEEEPFGGPQKDPYEAGVVHWFGKRLYLGDDTQISRLFWLLAEKPGVSHALGKVQRAVDGMETDRDEHGKDPFDKSMKRIAKALSKLRKHLRENDLDDHVIIIKEGPRDEPSYTLVSRFGN